MNPKSLWKSLRVGSRKNELSPTAKEGGLESSTDGNSQRTPQVSTAPANIVDIETLGKDASQDQLAVLQSSIPRSITPVLKDQYTLYPLHTSSNANSVPCEGHYAIDFVAVHGIDGGSHKTWTHGNGYYWLQDSIPNDFPGARVYSFGYPAEVLFTRGKSDISDFASALLEEVKATRSTKEDQRRPLIFICHSMGGIVVKQAMNISVFEKDRFGTIREAVFAIMFFGTPHRGSDYAKFFTNLARVVNVPLMSTSRFTGKTRVDLIKSLNRHSKTLSENSKQFRLQTNNFKIHSFLEQDSTPPLNEKVVDDMSACLGVEKETLHPMLGCDHRTLCRFSGRDDLHYKRVFNVLQEIATEATTKFEAELTAEDEPCLHSLSFQTMTSRLQETTLSAPHPKSCTWILTHPSFHSWTKSNENRLLCIKGHPGTGKSTLMSFLHHHHLIHAPADTIILSFFFHGNGSSLQKSELGMFRSLLHQLYKQSFHARKQILAFYQQRVKESGVCGNDWEWQAPELREVFTSILTSQSSIEAGVRSTKEVLIFIDALDEAVAGGGSKAAKELLDYFNDLLEKGRVRGIKICTSNRHYPVISPLLAKILVINVEGENRHDIAAFVSHSLYHGVESWASEDEEEKRELEEALVSKAASVFLWAKLRVEKVVKGLNDGVFGVRDVSAMVKAETNELADLYRGVLMGDVEVGLRGKAFVMMKWVCLAERPLTLGELRFAMGCDGGEDEIVGEEIRYGEVKAFVDTDVRMERLVKSLSGGLAEVRYYGKEGIVQLFHQSVNDFLRTDGLAILHRSVNQDSDGEQDLIGVCENEQSRACLRYLRCTEIFERVNVWIAEITDTYIFVQYATEHWATHAARAERHGINQKHLVEYFASCPKLLGTWKKVYRAVAYRDSKCPNPLATLIHIASTFSLESTALWSLQNGATLQDEDDINGLTPLDLAARHGHDTLVQHYIDLGASINGEVIGWQTPLEMAAANDQLTTVRLFLKNGAKLGKDIGAGSALGDAAGKGNTTLIEILLEAGTDIDHVTEHHGTALAVAAYEGKEEVVKFLIKRGAKVNVVGGSFGCALQAAVSGPARIRTSIVHYLLSKGAEVNLPGGKYGNSLQAAVAIRDIELVKLFLSKGADVNAYGGQDGTALHAAASSYQKMEFIQLLLEHGADINAQAGEYGTVLQAAAAIGDEEAVELFIKLGADVNKQGGRFGNALQAAVQYPEGGNLVSMLLEHGARIEGQSGYYGNLLQAAISKGNEYLAKRFLSMGLSINETGGHHGDNLQAAFPFCKELFIKYLVEQGANVNATGGEYGSPLRAAIFWNRPSIVALFLEHGADSNERIAGFTGTPLYQAVRKGDTLDDAGKKKNLEIVQALLDKGAEMEAQGPWNKSPLHLAIAKCNKPVVKLLVARGAHLDISEEERRVIVDLLEDE